ncbi:MAG TPA: CHAT domain-containing protein [Pirellulales bacterium]|nr:CHAT domain-containing protein [Pirellulales bacterium]
MGTRRASIRWKEYLRRCAWFVAALCAVTAWPRGAQAQLGSVPSPAYFATLPAYWNGNYPAALSAFQSELSAAIRSPGSLSASGRWIDSICYLTMAGECYYHMGQFSEALSYYNGALSLFATFPDWMLRAQFPATVAAAGSGARAVMPWGGSQRSGGVGAYPQTVLISQGNVNNMQTVITGGVIQQAVMVPICPSEIVRCTTLAIRRRAELMGPAAKYDALLNRLITLLMRRSTAAGNWSQAWVDLPLGTAQAAVGNAAAVATLEQSLMVDGGLDHPLTCHALLSLGQLALETGDLAKARKLFEEATIAAGNFEGTPFADPALMEEAFRYGQLVHLLLDNKNVYPPLAQALNWSRSHGTQQLHASLALLSADNLAQLGETTAANAALADARGVISRGAMIAADIGARLNLVTALTSYQAKQMTAGDQALAAAMAYQQTGSLWMFQIGLVDSLYLSGEIYDRVALLLYELVLRDPTPFDWISNPLEALSVLSRPHPLSYEHWFDATLRRGKEPELSLEVADRARRHRYLSSLPYGGRLLALRWILEGPAELLNEQALAQRNDLLARFPRLLELDTAQKKIAEELAAKPVVEKTQEARHEQAVKLIEEGRLGDEQELILREIAVRREPSELIFPPLRKTKDLQQALAPGHALLAFFVTSKEDIYGFLFSRDKYAVWNVGSPALVQRHLTSMLRDLGNTDQNHQLTLQDLGRENWKKSAAKLADALFDKSTVDLNAKFDELIVVPDGMLWYLPFEALPSGTDPAATQPLITQVRIRYAPTVGLAIPYHRAERPNPKPTGVVLGKLFPHDDETIAQTAFEPLSRGLERAVVLPHNPPAPSALGRTLIDGLIVLDDIKPGDGAFGWSPMQLEPGKSTGTLANWMTLPWGSPEWVVLPGFHTAAENGLKKGTATGNDLFLATCGLMSTGVRTVLISRWRSGGQSSFDLVREFVQELPHGSAAAAWQRAVELLTSQPLEAEGEPRLKKLAAGAQPPLAEHPFFWAGYMLVDSGRLEEGQAPPPPPMVNVKPKQAPPAAGDVKGLNNPQLPLPPIPGGGGRGPMAGAGPGPGGGPPVGAPFGGPGAGGPGGQFGGGPGGMAPGAVPGGAAPAGDPADAPPVTKGKKTPRSQRKAGKGSKTPPADDSQQN